MTTLRSARPHARARQRRPRQHDIRDALTVCFVTPAFAFVVFVAGLVLIHSALR